MDTESFPSGSTWKGEKEKKQALCLPPPNHFISSPRPQGLPKYQHEDRRGQFIGVWPTARPPTFPQSSPAAGKKHLILGGGLCVSPDKGKSQAERGANLFISKHKPDSSCATYTGKGKTGAAQEELWLFLGKLVLPGSVYIASSLPCFYWLTLPGRAFSTWTCLKCRKVAALTHLTQGLRRATEHS